MQCVTSPGRNQVSRTADLHIYLTREAQFYLEFE
jgi:hypothetical protein